MCKIFGFQICPCSLFTTLTPGPPTADAVYITTFGKGCIQFDRPAWLLEETGDPEEEAAEEVSTTARIRSALGTAPDPSDQLQSCAPGPVRIHDSAGSRQPPV